MNGIEEGGTEFYPDKNGYLIETDWDARFGMFIASARKEGCFSLHTIGDTREYAINAVKQKIRHTEELLRNMGS